MIDTQQINDILGIKEAYQLHDALESILFDKSKRENTFNAFLNVENDLFGKEHMDRRHGSDD